MAFDFKKEYKELYAPKRTPQIVDVPRMTFVSVCGSGNPNAEGGAYKDALAVLYAVAYTIKMSKMGDHRIEGYFDFVVPPLEGFWWQKDAGAIDFTNKDAFQWVSAIRLPDFVTQEEFDWAKAEAASKKNLDTSKAELLTFTEGLCAQILHVGSYDDEPSTIACMDNFIEASGYALDITPVEHDCHLQGRHHHEIYLSDPRRTQPEKLKTIIRHPIARKKEK